MKITCPLMRNPQVAKDFNEIKDATSLKTAYNIWSANKGNGIDRAPNGEPSILFRDIYNELKNRALSIRLKAEYYSNSFINKFGEWFDGEIKNGLELDENGEPKFKYGSQTNAEEIPQIYTEAILNATLNSKADYVAKRSAEILEQNGGSVQEAQIVATREWVEQEHAKVIDDTKQQLLTAFGLEKHVTEDGRITYVSKDGEADPVLVQFLDYIEDDAAGYYDANSKSSAVHHIIGISLNHDDPTTFDHELAHHYIRMFHKSRLIQTALRAVSKPGMTDTEREEALVELITNRSADSVFLDGVTSNSIVQRFWGKFAYMLYNMLDKVGLHNKTITNGLMNNVARAFLINEQQQLLNDESVLYQLTNDRKYSVLNKVNTWREQKKRKLSKNLYKDLKTKSRQQLKQDSKKIKYRPIKQDPTQTAVENVIQGTISRNKSYRQQNVLNSATLVQMQISENEVRQFADEVEEYRKQYMSKKGSSKLSNAEKVEMSHTPEEIKATLKLLNNFFKTARYELIDLQRKLNSAKSTGYQYYIVRRSINPETKEEVIEYLDRSQENEPGVEIKVIDWNELQDILQNTIGFYINTISRLQSAIRHPSFGIYYGEQTQNKLLSEITGVRDVLLEEDEQLGLNQLLSAIEGQYKYAIEDHLRNFISDYINKHTDALDDIKRERLIYSIYRWLQDQDTFGDIGWHEVWLGLASNSNSPLIRLMQDLIDNMQYEIHDAIEENGTKLQQLRNEALKHLYKNGILPSNFDKMFLEQDDGFTGNFAQHVNFGKFLNNRDSFINKILFGKNGYESKIRKRLGDPFYQLDVDETGSPIFPDECEDLDKEYRHRLNKWLSNNCVRRYTAKYYDAQIGMLSRKTLRAQREIDNQINNIIKAATVDGQLRTDLLTKTKSIQLMRLYEKKAQLSNPYDEFGREKEEGTDEYQIYKELDAWHEFQRDKIKYKMNYDAYENAKKNAANKELFEFLNTFRTINPAIYDELSKTFSTTNSKELDELIRRRHKLMSIIKRRGFTNPRIEEIWDFDNRKIREEYKEFLKNLKYLDEEINKRRTKLTKHQATVYDSYLGKIQVKTKNKKNWMTFIQKSIRSRIKEENPNMDSRDVEVLVNKEIEILYAVTGSGNNVSKKTPLSLFHITAPVSKKLKINGKEVDSIILEPIQAYSILDVENSNKEYVDDRFDDTDKQQLQPFSDKTKRGVPFGGTDYTNTNFVKNVESRKDDDPVKLYYNALIKTMKDAYESIPFLGEYDYRAPQIGCTTRQYFWRKIKKNPFKGLLSWIGYSIKRKYGPINETDIDINSDYELRPDGSRSMNIPVRYVKRLANPKMLNSDVLGSVMKFQEMALSFNKKAQQLPLFNTLLAKLNYNQSNNDRQRTFLQGIINRQFYDRLQNLDAGETNLAVYNNSFVKWLLKAMPAIKGLTQTGLLALGWIPGLVAYLDPAIQLDVDAIAGKYVDLADWTVGHGALIRDIVNGIRSAGKNRAYGIIPAGVRHFGLHKRGAALFHGSDLTQFDRLFLTSDALMYPFSFGEYTINARTFGMVMHSYRFYDGKYYNRREFINEMVSSGRMTEREARRTFNWNMQRHTLLNAYRVDEHGNFIPKDNKYGKAVNKELENAVRKRMQNRATNYNYIVPTTEKTKIQSHVLASFVVVMRTFMLVSFAERWRSYHDFQQEDETTYAENERSKYANAFKEDNYKLKGGFNFQSDEIMNGTFSGVVGILKHVGRYLRYAKFCLDNKSWNHSRYEESFQNKKDELNVSDQDLYALNRFLAEVLALLLIGTCEVMFHNLILGGDDDDYWKNVGDLILVRLFIERLTMFNPNTVFEIINSVTPSKSDFDRKFKLFDLLSDLYVGFTQHGVNFDEWERVNGGAYDKDTKVFRDFLHTTSSIGAHNLYKSSSVKGVKGMTKWYKSLYPGRSFWNDTSEQKQGGTTYSSSKSGFDDAFNFGSGFDNNSFGGGF